MWLLPGEVLPELVRPRRMSFLPEIWSSHIMQTYRELPTISRMVKGAEVEAAMGILLASKATDEGVSAYDFTCMQFKVKCDYDASQLRYKVVVQWGDPRGDCEERRGYALAINDDDEIKDVASFANRAKEIMDQITIRGELYFFKLHKYFPKKLKQVRSHRDGKVTVEFKNGRTVEGHEAQLDDKEFLAACVMVYDL